MTTLILLLPLIPLLMGVLLFQLIPLRRLHQRQRLRAALGAAEFP